MIKNLVIGVMAVLLLAERAERKALAQRVKVLEESFMTLPFTPRTVES